MKTRILIGDARERLADLPADSVHCVVTSPPYWGLRSYTGDPGMIGLEPTFDEHLENLVAVFREVRRVLRPDGTLWLNYGDAYNSGTTARRKPDKNNNVGGWQYGGSMGDKRVKAAWLKPKQLLLMPARVAMALQADGWWLRSEIVWHKPNPMPESVTDRPTCAHEKVFLMSRSARYFYDAEAVRSEGVAISHPGQRAGKFRSAEDAAANPNGIPRRRAGGSFVARPGANLRNVWSIVPGPFTGAHFAVFPPKLVQPCVKAGCPEGGTVLDPFGGAGTVGLVAMGLGRDAILVEISPEYGEIARARLAEAAPMFDEVTVSE